MKKCIITLLDSAITVDLAVAVCLMLIQRIYLAMIVI